MIFLDAAQGGGQNYTFLIMMGLVFVVMYFFMIRPQQKKRKEMEQKREEVKKGDAIVTIGGIHAKVVSVNETTLIVEVEDGTKIKVDKSAITFGETLATTK